MREVSPTKVEVRVLLFASAKDEVGVGELSVHLPPGSRLEDILSLPALRPLAGRVHTLRFALNEEFADLKAAVRDGDEIAVLPPVSGG